jgi:hypothetical protein
VKLKDLPFAADARYLSRQFGFSVALIRRWDAQGMLTRLQAPFITGTGKGAPVRYVVADFLAFLRSQPGSRVGEFSGRRYESAGDVLR